MFERNRTYARVAHVFGALFLSCAALAATVPAHADATLDRVKAAVQKSLGADAQVKAVEKTPLPGIYEIDLGTQIVYSDAQGHYMLVGDLVDAHTRHSLTQARLAELNKIDFSTLPLNDAIKYVKGDGSRKIAVFADPNCPYCKRFEEALKSSSVTNVTVYTFLFPVLAPDSATKSKAIWCAPDRLKAWHAWMLDQQLPAQAGNCSTPLDQNLALGRRLNVTGTPTIFLTDGRRLPGALTATQLAQVLGTGK